MSDMNDCVYKMTISANKYETISDDTSTFQQINLDETNTSDYYNISDTEGEEETDESSCSIKEYDQCISLENLNIVSEWAQFSLSSGFWDNDTEGNVSKSTRKKKGKKGDNVTLTCKHIANGLSHLTKVPGTSLFALTKLQLDSKGLTDISILHQYNSLMYIDLSDNRIIDMEVFSNMPYLIYLNLSKNRISEIIVDETKPLFLTRLDLSYNSIGSIPDMSNLWSLTHLDLSYNKIESIVGIWSLRHLKYLNLSHNEIELIDVRLFGMNLMKTDLSYNKLYDWTIDEEDLTVSQTLHDLNISHNCLVSLEALKMAYWLETLDVSSNNIISINEFIYLQNMKLLNSLHIIGNGVWEIFEARGLLIHIIPSLSFINGQPVTFIERYHSQQLFNNSLVHRAYKAFSWIMAKRHAAGPNYFGNDPTIRVYGCPIIALVGPLGSCRAKLIQDICDKFPNMLRQGRLVTTSKNTTNAMENVTEEEFYALLDSGKLVTHDFTNGTGYALKWEELKRDNKILILGLELSSALCLVWQGLCPKLILTITRDYNIHYDRLTEMFNEINEIIQLAADHQLKGCHYDVFIDLSSEDFSYKKYMLKNYSNYSSKVNFDEPESIFNFNSTLDEGYMDAPKAISYIDLADDLFEEMSKQSHKIFQDTGRSFSFCLSEDDYVDDVRLSETKDMKYKLLIETILKSREEYLDLHNKTPGLFYNTVTTDDMNHAKVKLIQIVKELYSNISKGLETDDEYDPKKDPLYEEVVIKYKQKLIEKLCHTNNMEDLICTTRERKYVPNKACFYFNK